MHWIIMLVVMPYLPCEITPYEIETGLDLPHKMVNGLEICSGHCPLCNSTVDIKVGNLTSITNVFTAEYSAPTHFVIGPVDICTTNGAVKIDDGVSLDEASREFWRQLSRMYPDCFPKYKEGVGK